MIDSEERQKIATRFRARALSGELHLHLKLCMDVLRDAGCAPEFVTPDSSVLELALSDGDRRIRYSVDVVHLLAEHVLQRTARDDARIVADELERTS